MTGKLRTLAPAVLAIAACASPATPPENNGTPRRVAVFAPSAAEALAALDLTDRVVAVGSHGPWPVELATLESAGSFDRPDLERILALECDLILTTESVAASDGYRRLKQLGVAVEALDTSTFDGVFTSLERIGELFGREARAAELAVEMRSGLETVRDTAAGLPPKKVLVAVGRDPLFVAGPGSHLDELIRLAGGVNLAADAGAPYQQFSIEAVLERGPEVIVDTSGDGAYWSRWPFLPAVRDGNVYRVEPNELAIPGMRLPEMARAMAERIHPEAFAAETKE
jgi:iron complex transport system substrate-binding protein